MALAQLNLTPGDLPGNAQKIAEGIRWAEAVGLDLIAFPELALMGYPIRDVIVRHPFLVEENMKWLHILAQQTGKTRALVGFVEPRVARKGEQRIGKPFYNAVAILGEGRMEGLVRKSLLPTYNEYEDDRTFQAADKVGLGDTDDPLTTIHGHRYGLSICEDIWNDAEFFEAPLYERDPILELAQHQPEVLINVSASVSRSRKEALKHNMLSHVARRHGRPLVYVNQVGAVDECIFDGASRAYDAEGNLIARAPAFEEGILIVNPLKKEGTVSPLPAGLETTLSPHPDKCFDAFATDDLARTYQALVLGIRDYWRKTGFRRALLGLSGGLDSAVVATLAVDALGAENVLAVSMPTALTPDENRTDARQLAQNLGMPFVEIPIGEAVEAFELEINAHREALARAWGAEATGSFAADNNQAMSRAHVLRMLGNDYHALPLATSDKSELYLGYATVNGDMSGALAPLGDVPKTKVRMLARWMNAHRAQQNALPEAVITKPSGADLALNPETGRLLTAEEALMPYEFADEVIFRIEALDQSLAQMLDASFQYEQQHTLSRQQKQAWLEKFFQRMSRAVFKWFVAPPILIVSGNGSITKTDYHHPIVAGRIDWAGLSDSNTTTQRHVEKNVSLQH